MAKRKKKRKTRKGRRAPRESSSIGDHRKEGRQYLPPLRQIDGLSLTSWRAEVFPDLLWLCGTIGGASSVEQGTTLVTKALDVMTLALDAHGENELVLTGHLSDFERVAEESREALVEAAIDAKVFREAFPEGLHHALSLYEEPPGAWLVEPYKRRGVDPDAELGIAWLTQAILGSQTGYNDVSTAAKVCVCRAHLHAGRVRFTRSESIDELVEVLTRYPHSVSEGEKNMVESSIRASYGVFEAVDGERDALRSEIRARWSRSFWRRNWEVSECMRVPLLTSGAVGEDDEATPDIVGVPVVVSDAVSSARAIHERFLARADEVDPDLFNPDRYEVLTGIVSRSLIDALAAMSTPLAWSEQGYSLLREVTESLIMFRYLIKHDRDQDFAAFKEYGRGRLKLRKLHLEKLVEDAEDPDDELIEYLDELSEAVNADGWEELQPFDVSGEPLGASVRDMAIDIGMKEEYDLVFAPASDALHGYWPYLDRHALEQCVNPLHGWHRLALRPESRVFTPSLTSQVMAFLGELVDEYDTSIELPYED